MSRVGIVVIAAALVEIITIVQYERIRRITGYLVGDLDRFNDAKLAEVEDRVSHDMTQSM